MRCCVLFLQELSNGGVVFINAGRSGAERMSATAALKHRFMAQARPSTPRSFFLTHDL